MGAARFCLLLRFPSVERAIDAIDVLYCNDLWVQRFDERVAVYVPPGQQPARIEKKALRLLRDAHFADRVGDVRRLTWDEAAGCFVNPDDPGIDAVVGTFIAITDFDPTDSTWEVTVRPSSIFVHRAVRGQLVPLRRPFLEATGEHYVLGALDEEDAVALVRAASRLDDVREATTRRLSRVDRWRLRQRFAGNYAVQDPAGPLFSGF